MHQNLAGFNPMTAVGVLGAKGLVLLGLVLLGAIVVVIIRRMWKGKKR